MNFNQLTAAAAAAAASNPNNISSFTSAVSSLLANSNIDLSQLANFGMGLNLGGTSGPASNNPNSVQNAANQQAHHHPNQHHSNSNRSNLHQAHTSHRSGGSSSNSTVANLNSSSHLQNPLANLQNPDNSASAAAAAASLALSSLPASLSNLTSSALADLAAGAAAVQHNSSSTQQHGSNSSGGRSSLHSAHHRSSSGSNHQQHQQQHHVNHHPTAHLTAAHQSTSSVSKALAAAAAAAAAHQQQQQQQHSQNNVIHHRNSSGSTSSAHNSLNTSNTGSGHNSSYPNTINNFNNILGNNNLTSFASSLTNSITANLSNNFNNIGLINNNTSIHNGSSNNSNNTSLITNTAINNIVNASANINNINTSTNSNTNISPTQTIIATNDTTSPPKNSIPYRIGDCVYFESSTSSSPLQIGRIEEICKASGDLVEVKVVLFYRRRDISSSLMTLADKYQYDESQEEEIKDMSEKDKNTLKQRELFFSRSVEIVPATSIRGKCKVQLLNESESLASYIGKEDYYFYTLVYDPQQKTITADRGEIRVGQRYQAEVQHSPIYTPQPGGDPADLSELAQLEALVYTPDHNLTEDDINKYLTIAKSVGTFARALDCSSSIKQPSLHLTAASASRDVTLLYAMNLLHQNHYDFGQAVRALVPSTGPVLCRDEIEEWTAGEATLFEEAIEKYGREFNEIRQDFLPWKSVKNIVEYYYMWKTTDRSINQRRMKALEAENKVSVLYISHPEAELKKSPNNVSQTPNPDVSSFETTKARPIKRAHDQQEEQPFNATSLENPNATQKRRQVSEPRLSAHVSSCYSPGENLRFISTPRHKAQRRELITKKQMRHLSRRPWERRTRLRT